MAETVDSLDELREEGLLGNEAGEKREVTAYERAAEVIIGGMHKVDEAKAVLQHANIPTKVLPPVLEIIITAESMIVELMKMAGATKIGPETVTFDETKSGKRTIDELTLEENIMLVQEAIRIMEAIPLILTAKDGFRSLQSVENLRSLVTGQSIMNANEALAFNTQQGKGVMGWIKNAFAGNKKK